jgi:hypothetical protein
VHDVLCRWSSGEGGKGGRGMMTVIGMVLVIIENMFILQWR